VIPHGMLEDLGELSLEHLEMVFIAMLAAAAIAIPGAILLSRKPRLGRWGLGFANILQTVPSLALFGFLIPIPFLGVGADSVAGGIAAGREGDSGRSAHRHRDHHRHSHHCGRHRRGRPGRFHLSRDCRI